MNILENLKEKLLLLKIQKMIIMQTKDETYFKNAANILDIIDILNEKMELDGNEIEHRISIIRYLNGYQKFQEKYCLYEAIEPFGISITNFDTEYAKKYARKID
ncbi:MAG: hypothetical protein IJ572_05245 [Bacilli bacterium]|nr:hypothetical protein [Bacilli bacterium]